MLTHGSAEVNHDDGSIVERFRKYSPAKPEAFSGPVPERGLRATRILPYTIVDPHV
jgi:hypothetical protein